jgi:hypothetical protein
MSLPLDRPDFVETGSPCLKSQPYFLGRRHLPPDGHLLRIQLAQATAKVVYHIADGYWGL